MPYSPKAYINPGISGNRHPAIHGVRDYIDATKAKASALLGDAAHQDLIYGKAGYTKFTNEAPSLIGEGKEASKANFSSKIDCK